MNWQALLSVLLDVVRMWLERRLPEAAGAGPQTVSGASDQQQTNQLADRLEAVTVNAPKGAQPVGHDAGIIEHVTELIAALRSGDWEQIAAVLKDLINHL